VNLRHRLCALLLMVLWLPYYGHCVQPHCAGAEIAEECCDHHGNGESHHDDHSPCADCHQHDPAPVTSLTLKVIPAPAYSDLAQWLVVLVEEAREVRPPTPLFVSEAGPAPPLPVLLVRTALPVRGPSA
jgi:hypothetical protein